MLTSIRTALERRTSDGGATAVEYVLLVVAIALLIAVAAFGLGKVLQTKLQTASTCVEGPTAANCPTS